MFQGEHGALGWVIDGNFPQGLSVEAWAECGKSCRCGVGPQGVTGKGGAGYKTQREASGEDLHPGKDTCHLVTQRMRSPREAPGLPVPFALGPLPPPP